MAKMKFPKLKLPRLTPKAQPKLSKAGAATIRAKAARILGVKGSGGEADSAYE